MTKPSHFREGFCFRQIFTKHFAVYVGDGVLDVPYDKVKKRATTLVAVRFVFVSVLIIIICVVLIIAVRLI